MGRPRRENGKRVFCTRPFRWNVVSEKLGNSPKRLELRSIIVLTAHQHILHETTRRPDVSSHGRVYDLLVVVLVLKSNFGGSEAFSTNWAIRKVLVATLYKGGEAEVNDKQLRRTVPLQINYDILRFEIAVDNVLRVQVMDREEQLLA